ncbi:hypothetical protein LCGC14_0341080 [marine sediment metagenome]|uniref:Methionyl-tRNA formyltransferase n=1 Tax=marine sediment metagenome TaxID=412755 RepID=A0A0F9W0Z6_9ZZZZ
MRVFLFGGGNKGSVVLKKLIELQQDVVGVLAFDEDVHETVWYERVQDIAKRNRIPMFIHDYSLKNLQPEIVFVAGWRYKIPKDIYSIPAKGCIVFHDSLLPKYRGFAPMNWAIINGETQGGATMFYIADEIDSGDIITQKSIYIDLLDTAESLEKMIAGLYSDMLERALPFIKSGEVIRRPQDHRKATYTCKRIPEDGLIDWNKSAWEVYNLIRGLSYPYPNAFSYNNGRKVKIREASLKIDGRNYVGRVPGRVVNLQGEWVEVLTGDGSLLVKPDCRVKSIKVTFGNCK